MLSFDGTVVIPAADPDDGEQTARALAPRLTETSTAVVVHVVEKGKGSIDAVPVEQREEYAQEIFDRASEVLSDTPAAVESEVLFAPDIVEAVFGEAENRDADAVVFIPRQGSVVSELLTGGVARRLVKNAEMPVVVLPKEA